MKREDVLKMAGMAIEQRLSRDWMDQLFIVARKYKEPHNSAAVENWLGEIQDKDFEIITKEEKETWLKDWLNRLPE